MVAAIIIAIMHDRSRCCNNTHSLVACACILMRRFLNKDIVGGGGATHVFNMTVYAKCLVSSHALSIQLHNYFMDQ